MVQNYCGEASAHISEQRHNSDLSIYIYIYTVEAQGIRIVRVWVTSLTPRVGPFAARAEVLKAWVRVRIRVRDRVRTRIS